MDSQRPHTAVLVVDMLNGFCRTGNLASARLDSVTPRLRRHLGRAEAAGADLVFLVDTHAPDDPEFAMFPPHCVEGSGEDEVVPELAGFAARGTVVRKHTFSGFYGTALGAILERLAPDVVEVAGVCTDICVLHTVAGLRLRGYEVVVHRELVETYDAPGHDADAVQRFALAHIADVLGAQVA
ncbi:MAG: isochorismatase family cysteine hydrolase [Thermoleophilia bacterium]